MIVYRDRGLSENKNTGSTGVSLAEREGFEPSLPCGKRALQARALGQTTLSLRNSQCMIIHHNFNFLQKNDRKLKKGVRFRVSGVKRGWELAEVRNKK